MRRGLARTVLGLYLIASGVIALVPSLHLGALMPVFAIVAGCLLLIER